MYRFVSLTLCWLWTTILLAQTFPDPPSPYTHVAQQTGAWKLTSTWQGGQVPNDDAIVHIPAGIKVTVTTQEQARLDFIRVDGELRMAVSVNTRLNLETLYISTSGSFVIGALSNPVHNGRSAQLNFIADHGPIDLAWDPNQMSRGLVSDGTIRIYGEPRSHVTEMDASALQGAQTLNVNAPVDWQVGDSLVLAGTQFKRFSGSQEEVVEIQSIQSGTISLTTGLAFDHQRVRTDMNLHLAHLNRNVILSSESQTLEERGHVMLRNGDVDIRYTAFIDLGRTDKRIPLDELVVDPITGIITQTPNTQIQNRRGRYALHFHKNGMQPTATNPPSKVYGCVVRGTMGWGYVNHSSHVDFRDNVCYDFAGAGFVTESGDELGNFFNNIAIRGTGVPGEYFIMRQVFANDQRPQPLGDFAFGGDGFWFQGPALRVRDNVANSCNGTGMFWFTTGAVEIQAGHYVGFPISAIANVYAGYPDIANLQTRTWTGTGVPNQAVVADLPILEMTGFDGYANLVGFRLRFNNFENQAFYGEDPFDFDTFIQGSAQRIRQTVSGLRLWNNEMGFRIRYNEKSDWHDVTNVNRLRYDNPVKHYVGAELFHQTLDQTFSNLLISGYGQAMLLANLGSNNSGQVSFSGLTLANYANADDRSRTIPCATVSGVAATNITGNSALIQWQAHANGSRFLIRFREVGQSKWRMVNQTNGAAVSQTIAGLSSTTQYEYQVLAACSDNLKQWSSPRFFTTQ